MPPTILPEVDVCVIGSGGGGGPVAYECAKAGLKVVVLEKGPRYAAKDFIPHDEIRHTRRDFWLPWDSEEPHVLAKNGGPPERSRWGWTASCVGGATAHMMGMFMRLRPEDFRVKSLFGAPPGVNVADWPISYEDLAPFYEEVEQYLGISGAADEIPAEWRPAKPFPLPTVATHPLKRHLFEAAKRIGLHPFSTPRAILSEKYKERSGCSYCHFCADWGCEVDAKSSALVTWIRDAEATGNCEVRPKSMAARIEVDADRRARRVVYLTPEGEKVQPARVIAVACAPIESARLLLNSASPAFPNGLANGSGQVGKNLTFSAGGATRAVFEYGKSKVPDEALRAPGMFVDTTAQDYYVVHDKGLPYPKVGTIQMVLVGGQPIGNALMIAVETTPPKFGKRLKDEMRARIKGGLTVEGEQFLEFFPTDGTKVTVDGSVKDRFGLPVARIDLAPHPWHVQNALFLQNATAKIYAEAGATEVLRLGVGTETPFLQHGTCRFGEDAAVTVLDPWCAAHEVKNLFVTDGSCWPTSGAAPPTLTLYANALRTARHLVAEAKAGRL